jgi:patatin-like phospholipase/acyl hydrolase
MSDYYRILSFCGGGIRGLISSGLLSRVQQESGRQIVEASDVYAGTSTGADIISQILANYSPGKIYENYQTTKLFDGANTTDASKPAYKIDKLIAAQELLHGGKGKPLSDYDKRLVLTTFFVGSSEYDWTPILLNNFPGSITSNTPLVDAVVSSSVMPGMYGTYNRYTDGGFAQHDPTLIAIAFALANGVKLENITAMCFGTGQFSNKIISDPKDWGAQQWQFGDPTAEYKTPKMLVNGQKSPVLAMSLNGTSTYLMPKLCQLLLGERYCYVNPLLPFPIAENDVKMRDVMVQLVNDFNLDDAIWHAGRFWPNIEANGELL